MTKLWSVSVGVITGSFSIVHENGASLLVVSSADSIPTEE